MATNNGDPDWEAIGREQLERTARRKADDVGDAIRLLGVQIGRGTADADNVVEARKAIEEMLYVLEQTLVEGVPGAEAGGGATRYIRDNGAAADYLRVSMEQVNEVTGGAAVQLDVEEIRTLCHGKSVQVETEGGIDVELLPAEPPEVNPGP